jgi:selenocysteine-specific elongation factor
VNTRVSGVNMYVIGTAGHVDHGKSSLVEALTTIDPDRLQEEKKREMTIDLGFAWMTLPSGIEVSIVDVPGHGRFIKNMLAGIGAIDIALVVVAADESVMPQTREHLAILELLGIRKCVVALTKADLVDPEWLELVTEDIRETFRDGSLEAPPVIPVSSITKVGLNILVEQIDTLLQNAELPKDLQRPRLAIDRAFTMTGFGTVVTGTLIEGRLTIGQDIELAPSGRKGRIRGLQTHQRLIKHAIPGTRVAVNLSGVSHRQIQRGEVLTSTNWIESTGMIDVSLRVARWGSRGIKTNTGVTFHSGTSESTGKLRLLDAKSLKPGEESWAQVHLASKLPLVKGDAFVVRSSTATIGGGMVIDINPRRHRPGQQAVLRHLEALAKGTSQEALLESLPSHGLATIRELADRVGLVFDEAREEFNRLISNGTVIAPGHKRLDPNTLVASRQSWEDIQEKVSDMLATFHKKWPLRRGLPREELRSRLSLSAHALTGTLAQLAKEGIVLENASLVASLEHRVQLGQRHQSVADEFLQILAVNPFTPPTDHNIDPEILAFMVSEGTVVQVAEQIVFSRSAYEEMVQKITDRLQEEGRLTVADVRTMFSTSRKYAVPLLEHLDQQRITQRLGDERILVRPK